jgi:hypothetical protein
MKDLAVDQKKPWSGPGKDPRRDQFMDEVEEENIDDDDGDETYLDPGVFMHCRVSIYRSNAAHSGYGAPVY